MTNEANDEFFKISTPQVCSFVPRIDVQSSSLEKRSNIFVEKLSDASIEMLQKNKMVIEQLDYSRLRGEAFSELEEDFKKFKLFEEHDDTEEVIRKKRKKREIAIEQKIRQKLSQTGSIKIALDFNEFLYKVGLIENRNEQVTGRKLSRAIQAIKTAQKRSYIEWREESISPDYENIYYDFKSAFRIPMITIRVDQKINKNINSIEELLETRVRNKHKYIKDVIIEYDALSIASFVALGKNYVLLNKKKRFNFKISHSFKLDSLLSSVESVQNIYQINSFSLKTLNSMFGTNYKRLSELVKQVILPSIDELEKIYPDVKYSVSKPFKFGNEKRVSFFIERKDRGKMQLFNTKALTYYIASRHYFTNFKDFEERDRKIPDLFRYAKLLEENLEDIDDDDKILESDTLTYGEYKKEVIKAIDAQDEIDKIMNKKEEFFEEQNIHYDREMMCFVEGKIEENTRKKRPNIKLFGLEINNPIKSLEYYNNVLKVLE